MGVQMSPRRQRGLLVGSLSVLTLPSGLRLIEYGPNAWRWVPVYAVVGFVLVGPLAWVVRDRLSPARRETLTYVAAGVGFLGFVVLFGLSLAFGWFGLAYLDAAVVGGVVGSIAVMVVERTVVPDRLRAPDSKRVDE